MEHLVDGGGYEVRVSAGGGAWNPQGNRYSRPGQGSWVFEAGIARYRLEGSEVHLTFTTENGSVRQFVGPVPKPVAPGVRRMIRLFWVGLLVLMVAGFAIGYALGPSDARGVTGVLGAGLGGFVPSLALRVFQIVRAVRSVARRTPGEGAS